MNDAFINAVSLLPLWSEGGRGEEGREGGRERREVHIN
jgi:hypothetical protein